MGFLFQIQGIYLTLLSLPTAEETRKLALNVLRLIQSQRISFVCQPLVLGYQPSSDSRCSATASQSGRRNLVRNSS